MNDHCPCKMCHDLWEYCWKIQCRIKKCVKVEKRYLEVKNDVFPLFGHCSYFLWYCYRTRSRKYTQKLISLGCCSPNLWDPENRPTRQKKLNRNSKWIEMEKMTKIVPIYMIDKCAQKSINRRICLGNLL